MPKDGATVDPVLNLARLRERLNAAARDAGRDGSKIVIVAVAKKHGPERLLPLLQAGHRVFGENRVQEAQAKWPALRARVPDIELHLVGPLQTNKAKEAVALFDVIETVDREKLARAIAGEIAAQHRRPRLYVQVNTGEEAQKAGVAPEEADAFIDQCRREHGLSIEGLMCIPPADEGPAPHFALLVRIARRNGIEVVSMGMSGDYDIAAQLGATHVRVGTAIFGPRPEQTDKSPAS